MKTLLQFSLALTMLIGMNQKSSACVDFHPDSVIINILADTVNCNFILEISNLNMFGGNPNDFCSCGITNSIPDASTILWVAFVDAETQEPVEGFNLWDYADLAGDSWEDADPGAVDWNGFISGVNSAGIVSGQEVNLWIVMDVDETDPQWSWLCSAGEGNIWEAFGSFTFGTDEWDNEAGTLANSHQDMTAFWETEMYVSYITPDEYQVYLDVLENFYSINEQALTSVSIYPNPTSEVLYVDTNFPLDQVILRDLLGKEVVIQSSNTRSVDVSALPEGMYFLQLKIKGISQTRKVKISH